MTSYMIHGGIAGFLLVLALNLLNGNGYGISLMWSCIASIAFAYVSRWFMRSVFSEMHLSVWEQQQAAAQAQVEAAEGAAAEGAAAEGAAAEGAAAEGAEA